jgi:hypothetical protein
MVRAKQVRSQTASRLCRSIIPQQPQKRAETIFNSAGGRSCKKQQDSRLILGDLTEKLVALLLVARTGDPRISGSVNFIHDD